jgi:hypothetical protein
MAILSRRCLQALISASTRFSAPAKLGDVVSRLNQPGKGALAAEWELIVLNGLANILPVEHEVPSSTGGRNLDVRFLLGRVLSARLRNLNGSAYFGFLPAGLTLRNSLSHL